MTLQQKSPLMLDKSTLIPLGFMMTIIVACITGFSWLQSSFMEIKYQLKDNTEKIKEIKDEIQLKMMDRWTRTDMSSFVDLLKARNPELKVPDIK